MILEGSYPYVHGGVSSWTHQFIQAMPDVEFVIWCVGANAKDKGKFKYTLPKNVSEIYEVFLDLAAIGSIIIIFMVAILCRKNHKSNAFILIVHYKGDEAGDEIIRSLGNMKYYIKSKTIRNEETELTLQVSCKQDNLLFTEKIKSINQVLDLTLVQYNG